MTEPYYADDSVTLYLGDFREVLPDIQADCVIADPPYGETSLDWDIWPDGWPIAVAPYASSMWCFGSMRMFLDRSHDFADWRLSQDVVWEKHNGSGPTMPDRFQRVHEHATHWYRGGWAGIYARQQRIAHAGPDKGSLSTSLNSDHRGTYKPRSWTDDGTRAVRSVIYARSMHQQNPINETQKPLAILSPLIEYACPPGGMVLDPFAGSASTLVAARSLGRRAVGAEKRESQCEKAALRLSQGVLDFGEVS